MDESQNVLKLSVLKEYILLHKSICKNPKKGKTESDNF